MSSTRPGPAGPAGPNPTPTARSAGLADTRATRRVGLTLALGGLLVVLDTTITIVAIPTIVVDLHTTLITAQWITTAYLLAMVGVIPVAAWASEEYGARRVYLVALGAFTLACLCCSLAPDIAALIVFRVVQGAAGALINPLGQTIGLRTAPRAARGRMMALLGLPILIGPVLGPPLSGWLIAMASWRWIFAVDVPIGLATLFLARVVLPRLPRSRSTRLDVPGLLLVPSGAVLLVAACALIGRAGELSWPAGLEVLTALGLLTTFVRRAWTHAHPLLDLRLLRQRCLAGGAGVLVAFGAAYFGAISILPVLVQAVRGDSALQAGLLTVPQALATGLTLQVATRGSDRLRPRPIVVGGVSLALLGTGSLLLAVSTGASYPVLAAIGVLLGVGCGATLLPAATLALRDLEGEQTAAATTLIALAQQLAAALGTAAVAATLTISLDSGVVALHGGGLGAIASLTPGTRSRLEPALSMHVATAYVVSGCLMLLALVIAVFALPRSHPDAPDSIRER